MIALKSSRWVADEHRPTKEQLGRQPAFIKSLLQQINRLTIVHVALPIRDPKKLRIPGQVVVPPELISDMVASVHEATGASHEGIDKTLRKDRATTMTSDAQRHAIHSRMPRL